MPNVTISVPEDLKNEMDQYTEVSWSGICRKAIKRYVDKRKNPTPKIQLDLSSSRLTADVFDTGYPTLTIDLRIYNKMDSAITTDRILANISFWKENQIFAVGLTNDLHKRLIGANSVGGATLRVPLVKEKIEALKEVFKSSFECRANCTVYVDGFEQYYSREVRTTIPIDVWQNVLEKSLKLP